MDFGIKRNAAIPNQTDQVLCQMGAAFYDPQSQNTRVSLESMHSPEQGRDMGGLLLARGFFQRQKSGFHRIHCLCAIIDEQGPDFIHFVRHAALLSAGVSEKTDQAAMTARIVLASSSPVFSSRSWDTVPDGLATTPSAPNSRAFAA